MRIKKSKSTKSPYQDISTRLREIRLDHRLTQREFGSMVGLTAAAIGAIEKGLYTPNFSVLRIIHQRMGVSYDYIIDGVTDKDYAHEYKNLKEEHDRLKKIIDKMIK